VINGIRTYFLKISFIKRPVRNRIKTQKPKGLVEKISRKKPEINELDKPKYFCGFSKMFIKTIKSRLTFKTIPKI